MRLMTVSGFLALSACISPRGQAQSDTKVDSAKPGSVTITANVDGYTQGTEFNTKKYPFKYSGVSRLNPDQFKILSKAGDIPDAVAHALLSAVLWPGQGDKLDKINLKSDGTKITGGVELSHRYGKQGVHILKFKLEGDVQDNKLALRAVDPVVFGSWDWGGGMIKLVGKVDIQFQTSP